jgi:hypothetical protein
MTNDALRLASVVAPILAAQGEYVQREIQQNRIPNLELWIDPMVEAVFPVWAAVYLAGWRDMGHRIVRNRPRAAKSMGRLTFHKAPQLGEPFFAGVRPNVLATIQTQVYEFVQATMETSALSTADAIEEFRQALAEGMERGEGVKLINRRVQEIFQDAYRAARIGQTEASRASHSGQLQASRESGVVVGKRWEASSDACPVCLALDGVEKPLDEPFMIKPSGGPYAVVMHPPAHPHCFCAMSDLYGEADVDEYELMELLGV